MTTRAGTSTRAAAVALLAALAAGGPAAAVPVAHRAAAAGAPAGARLVACRRSPSIDARTAVVGTWMRPVAAGRQLALRIDLWQRTPGTSWTLRSDVPGLGGWTTPSDALVGTRAGDVFKYRQAVGRLAVPATYRFHVAFRWLAPDGAVVRASSATTRACRQPDLRPDLVLDAVTATAVPRKPGLVRYALVVGNEGRSPVARAAVAATLPGDATPGMHVRAVRSLVPGDTVQVTFIGPGCAAGAQPASFVADPSNALDEADETNNALAASCPAP